MSKPPADTTIEKRTLSTMWLVFHPKAGLICTEPYKENAEQRADDLLGKYKDEVFIIEAASISRVTRAETKRVYKIEKNRLHIEQETL